jgi:hypothetical protein
MLLASKSQSVSPVLQNVRSRPRRPSGDAAGGAGGFGRRLEAVELQFGQPRSVAPFDPHSLRRHAQQVRARKIARALGIGQGGAQPGQCVAENISNRTLRKIRREVGGAAQTRQDGVRQILNDERRAALCDPISQSHARKTNRAARVILEFGMKPIPAGSRQEPRVTSSTRT